MEKQLLVVKTIEVTDLDKAKDIALQSWNIKREGALIDLKFIEGTNRLVVKYLDTDTNNMDSVTSNWGEVIDVESEWYIVFNTSDLNEGVASSYYKVFDAEGEDGFTLDYATTHFNGEF